MYFDISISIERTPADVFRFLRDKEKHPQEKGSPVLLLEKTTPGPAGVGTRYREVVQMLPFYRGTILSEITTFREYENLEEDFWGPGMHGHLIYQFRADRDRTILVQREVLHYHGILRLFEPLFSRLLGPRLRDRLDAIKALLEEKSSAT